MNGVSYSLMLAAQCRVEQPKRMRRKSLQQFLDRELLDFVDLGAAPPRSLEARVAVGGGNEAGSQAGGAAGSAHGGENESSSRSNASPPKSNDLDDDFLAFDSASDDEVKAAEAKLAAKNLKNGGELNPATVEYCADRGGCLYVKEFFKDGKVLENTLDQMLERATTEEKTLFIPVVLQAGFGTTDHMVVFVVDPKSKTIEYYNSNGEAYNHAKELVRKVKNTKMKAPEFLRVLANRTGYEFNPQKPSKHQKSDVDCGAFAIWLMGERSKRPFASICEQQSVDIATFRKNLAREIRRNA